jgi:hypothetical protein
MCGVIIVQLTAAAAERRAGMLAWRTPTGILVQKEVACLDAAKTDGAVPMKADVGRACIFMCVKRPWKRERWHVRKGRRQTSSAMFLYDMPARYGKGSVSAKRFSSGVRGGHVVLKNNC